MITIFAFITEILASEFDLGDTLPWIWIKRAIFKGVLLRHWWHHHGQNGFMLHKLPRSLHIRSASWLLAVLIDQGPLHTCLVQWAASDCCGQQQELTTITDRYESSHSKDIPRQNEHCRFLILWAVVWALWNLDYNIFLSSEHRRMWCFIRFPSWSSFRRFTIMSLLK